MTTTTRLTRRGFMVGTSVAAVAASAWGAGGSPGGDLSALSATQAVTAMRDGDIKAEDYAAALLARAEKLKALNAFITLRPDQVRHAAREADRARSQGRALGLLHG